MKLAKKEKMLEIFVCPLAIKTVYQYFSSQIFFFIIKFFNVKQEEYMSIFINIIFHH